MLSLVLLKNVGRTVRQTVEGHGGISTTPGVGVKLGTLDGLAPYGHLDQGGAVS